MPAGTAAAVRELQDYDWRLPEAWEKYEQIKDLVGRELLDSRFEGIKDALQSTGDPRRRADPRDARRPQQPACRARAGPVRRTIAVRRPMAKHGEFFPENPRDVEELIDARRPGGPPRSGC